MRYLHERAGYYYFRRRVPTDLVGIIPAPRLHFSLHTSDKREARRLYPAALATVEDLIANERRKLTNASHESEGTFSPGYRARRKAEAEKRKRHFSRAFGQLSETDIQTMLRRWFADALAERQPRWRDAFTMCSAASRDELLAELGDTRQCLMDEKPPMRDFLVSREVRQLLADEDCATHPDWCADAQFRRFYGLVLEGMLTLNRIATSLVGEGRLPASHAVPSSTGFFDAPASTSHHVNAPRSTVTLDVLIDRFEKDPKRQNLREATKRGYGLAFRAIREQLGGEKLVSSITREEILTISETLLHLPARATLKAPNAKLFDLASAAKEHGLPQANAKTYNIRVQSLSTLFNYAVVEQVILQSPAKRLEIPVLKSEDDVTEFSFDQLSRIFAGGFFTKFIEADHAQFTPKHDLLPCRFWAPLIALFHGMRSNEILQIQVANIAERDGVYSIKVDGELKNEHSRRLVPVHPMMLKFGFAQYVENVKRGGHERLFPDAKKSSKGKYSEWFSKAFQRYLIQIEIKKRKERFHSFRHTFATGMRRAGASKEHRCAIGGWSDSDSLEGHYGEHDLPSLFEALRKLEYPGVDLSHLYAPEGDA